MKKTAEHITDEFIHENLCKGIKGLRFTDSNYLNIGNRFMIALLYAFDSKLVELAEYCKVTPRIVQKWCYGKTIPNPINLKKITHYFNVEVDILFGEYAYRYPYSLKMLKQHQSEDVRVRTNKTANIKKPLLYGLIWLYKIQTKAIAEHCNISHMTMKKILYTDYEPSEGVKIKLSQVLQVPQEILFMKGFRTRTAERRASGE